MNETMALLEQMIKCRPVSADIPRVNKVIGILEHVLAKGSLYTRIETFKDRKVLYASPCRSKTPAILLNPHVDVVPADEDGFCPRKKGGWLYGRGSGDCLSNCAILAQALIRCRKDADVGAIFSSDEEIGGETIKGMIQRGYRGRFIIILDSTGKGYEMATAEKGLLTLNLVATGKACHGSTPWVGVNAVERLIKGYLKVKPLFPAVRAGDEWHDTCSANVIRGGTVFNRVPDRAELTLDIRHTEKTSVPRLVQKIRSASGLKVEVVTVNPYVYSDPRHPMIRDLQQFMSQCLRHGVRTFRMNAATDARHFSVLKVPIVMIAVPYEGAHSAQERVSIRGLIEYQQMLVKLCNQGLPALKHGELE